MRDVQPHGVPGRGVTEGTHLDRSHIRGTRGRGQDDAERIARATGPEVIPDRDILCGHVQVCELRQRVPAGVPGLRGEIVECVRDSGHDVLPCSVV